MIHNVNHKYDKVCIYVRTIELLPCLRFNFMSAVFCNIFEKKIKMNNNILKIHE